MKENNSYRRRTEEGNLGHGQGRRGGQVLEICISGFVLALMILAFLSSAEYFLPIGSCFSSGDVIPGSDSCHCLLKIPMLALL